MKETHLVVALLPSEEPTKPCDAGCSSADVENLASDCPCLAPKSDAKTIPVQRVKPFVRYKDDNERKSPTLPEMSRKKETLCGVETCPFICDIGSDRCTDCGRRQNSPPCPKCGSLPAQTPPSSQSDQSLEETCECEEEPPKAATKRPRCSRNLPQCCQKCGTVCQPDDDAFVNVPPCPCSQSPCKKVRAPKATCECGGLPTPKYCVECGCPLRPTGDLCKSSESPKDISPLTCPLCRECLTALFPGAHKKRESCDGPCETSEPCCTRQAEVLLTCSPCKKCRAFPPPEALPNKTTCRCDHPVDDRVSQPKICIKCGCPDYSDDDIAEIFQRVIQEATLNKSKCLCDQTVEDSVSQPKTCEKCGCPVYSDQEIGKVSDRGENVIQEASMNKPKCCCERPVHEGVPQPKICEKCGCPVRSDADIAKVSDKGGNETKEAPLNKSKCLCKRALPQPKICEKCGCPVYSDGDISKGGKSKCLCKHDHVSKSRNSDEEIANPFEQGGNPFEQGGNVAQVCPEFDAEQRYVTQRQSPVTCPLCKQCTAPLPAESAENKPTCVKAPEFDPLIPHQICLLCGCSVPIIHWSPFTVPLCVNCSKSLSSQTPRHSPDRHESTKRPHSLSLHQMHSLRCSSPTEFNSTDCTCSAAKHDDWCHQRVNFDLLNNRNQCPREYAFSSSKPRPRSRNEPNCRCPRWTGRQLYQNFLSAVNLDDGFLGQPSCEPEDLMEPEEFRVSQRPCQSWINEQPSPMETPGAAADWAYQVAHEEEICERLIWPQTTPASTYARPSDPMEWQQLPSEDLSVCVQPFRSCECPQPVECEAFQESERFHRQPPEIRGSARADCFLDVNSRRRSRQADGRHREGEPRATKCRKVRISSMNYC